jgi:hypothetical protein
MAQEEKPQPSATPPQAPLVDRIAHAIENEESRRQVSVKMTVRGGLPSQRYTFEFAATGDGAATCRVDDRLRKRAADPGKAQTTLAAKDFVDLLKKLRPALERPTEPPSFLPDTVIGILEVSDGTAVRRIYFAADPEQAKTQGKEPPREVRQVVEAIYAAGARLTGGRDVKP